MTLHRKLASALTGAALAAAFTLAQAQTLERVRSSGILRVCIWPDYYGITYRNPRTQQLAGIDIDLSAELARDLGVGVGYVDSSFPQLVADIDAGRCDVAMFAIGMLPSRKEQLAFTEPYLQSDIYGVTTRSSRTVRQWADIDQPGVIVAVQAGTFMEPVMREALKQARMTIVRPPATREQELEAGRVDVFMTDYPYSRRLLDNADWARLVTSPKPFFVLPYGYAVKRGDARWLARLDEFVTAIKRDGRLVAAARRHGLSDIVVARYACSPSAGLRHGHGQRSGAPGCWPWDWRRCCRRRCWRDSPASRNSSVARRWRTRWTAPS